MVMTQSVQVHVEKSNATYNLSELTKQWTSHSSTFYCFAETALVNISLDTGVGEVKLSGAGIEQPY
jgi:hypothetical protein